MTVSCGNSGKTESKAFNMMLQVMLSDSVPVISVPELSQIRDEVTILDTREAEEYSVSRIPGSIHAGFDEFDISMMDKIDKDSPIVVYCSVGYRSEKIGKKIADYGFQDVRNLYGGIFEWVNQHKPIVNKNGPVNKVHPYSKIWSPWITNNEIIVTYSADS